MARGILPRGPAGAAVAQALSPDLVATASTRAAVSSGSTPRIRRRTRRAKRPGAGRSPVRQHRPGGALVVLLSGGASSLLAVPGPRALARGQDRDRARADERGRSDRRSELRAETPVRHQGRAPRGGGGASRVTWAISDVHGPVAGRSVRHRIRSDGRGSDDLRRRARCCAHFGRRIRDSGARHHAISRAAADETPAPGDPRLANASYEVIGTRQLAMEGAAALPAPAGYEVAIVDEASAGEARDAGDAFTARALSLAADAGRPCASSLRARPPCTCTGTGRGGRNQEFALGARRSSCRALRRTCRSRECGHRRHRRSDRCGGRARRRQLRPAGGGGRGRSRRRPGANNAAYDFFRALGDLIAWGPDRHECR